MSVFGGDSWAREAQYRKRRVDDILVESLDVSSYQKLSSGKYACLVCPHNPILDSPLMFSMHSKGSRHRAAESKLKEKELAKRDEINKRRALLESSTCPSNLGIYSHECKPGAKPLIEQTRRATSEVIYSKPLLQSSQKEIPHVSLNNGHIANDPSNFSNPSSLPASQAVNGALLSQHFDFQERRERELKFTAVGWKRDCHGKWFQDENVEFDSDEEDPNICVG